MKIKSCEKVSKFSTATRTNQQKQEKNKKHLGRTRTNSVSAVRDISLPVCNHLNSQCVASCLLTQYIYNGVIVDVLVEYVCRGR